MPTLGINPSEYVACIDFLSIIQPKCSYIVIAINMFRYGIGTDFSIECGLVDTLQDNADAWWSDFLCSINALGNWEKHFSKMRLVETLKKKRIEDLTLTNIGCNKIDWGLNHLKINFSKKELPNLKWYIGMYGFNTSVSSQNRSNIKWNG
jgi:hypothetical protein